jgi:hypothetical protein
MRAAGPMCVAFALLAGCGFKGTVAVVDIDGSVPGKVARIDLSVSLGAKNTTVTLTDKGGAIALPTSAALQFNDGDNGTLTVVAAARDNQGVTLGMGSGTGELTSGHTTTITISLRGSVVASDGGADGMPAVVVITPDNSMHDFGTVITGTSSAPFTFTFTNAGTVASGALSAMLSGTGANDFQLANDGCTTQVLAPGANCTVKVQFQPKTTGSESASLTVGDGTNMAAVTVSGMAIAPGALALMPAMQDFGAVVDNSSSGAITFTVQNSGGQTSGTLVTALTGTDKDQFTVKNDTCAGTMLAPSRTCTLDVALAPNTLGSKTASLTVTGTPGGTAVAALSGTSISAALLSFSAGAGFDFGTVDANGGSAMQTVTVKNTGGQTSGTITTTLPSSSDFSASDGCNGKTLAGGATCDITVTFAPKSYGAKSYPIMVGATPGGSLSTTLTGTGRDYVTLTVQKNGGNGSGTVTSTDGMISCGSTCSAMYPRTSSYVSVTLNATASTGSTFTGWSLPSCTGIGSCALTMNASSAVTANFALETFSFNVAVGNVSGVGSGKVTSSDSVFNCTGNCSHTYNYGTTAITLTASTTAGGAKFLGWGGDCHGNSATCSLAPTAARNVTAQFGSTSLNYVFVTSTTMTMPLGTSAATSLSAADGFCATRASAAKLGGTKWLAFLATSSGDAYSRLSGSGANGWVRTDGFPFADTVTSMKPNTAKTFYPPKLDELGNDLGNDPTNYFVATGQFPLGIATGETCTDWTSSSSGSTYWAGAPPNGAFSWHSYTSVGCNQNVRLYCFQADGSSTVAPPAFSASTNRIIWVSDATLTPTAGGSISNLDATCQSEAQTNGLAAPYTNYIVLLPPNLTTSAISRFDTSASALPWARIDGVVVAGPAALGAGILTAPIQASLSNTYPLTPSVWTAATANPGTSGGYDCNDWASNINSVFGGQGDIRELEPSWWAGNGGYQTCNTSLHIFCAHK